MEQLTDLKAILHSKRANIYYLDMCRVMQKDGRVLYLTATNNESQYWNIPIANTTVLLLGTGTSITQAAVRMLASAGVMIGFCGSGATPLVVGTEIEWLSPQNEYRPTEYLQGWMSFWFDEAKRLNTAKQLQQARISYLQTIWSKDKDLKAAGFDLTNSNLNETLDAFKIQINHAASATKLLQNEALLTKKLYQFASNATKYGAFTRDRETNDSANSFLNHGNYLAYGLGATTLWVLGIPHSFAVMHGKTRRGALVFDVADLVKDALVLPWAFICATENATEQEFRQQCLQAFTKHNALSFMFDQVKEAALHNHADLA